MLLYIAWIQGIRKYVKKMAERAKSMKKKRSIVPDPLDIDFENCTLYDLADYYGEKVFPSKFIFNSTINGL